MLERYHSTISESVLFAGLDQEAISAMLKCLNPRVQSYKRNDYIFISGDSFTSVGIVLYGLAGVFSEKPNGDRVVINTLRKSEVFGEMIAFSHLAQWPNSVQALKSCKILLIPKARIIGECPKLCPWHRSLVENFLKLLSQKALMLNKKVEYLSIKGIRAKVSTYLYEQYRHSQSKSIVLNLNRNELADFLSVSRPSMSRELCKMRDEGIIDFYLSRFKIKDSESLKSMAEL